MGSTRTSILEILRNANSSVSILRSCGSARYLAAQRRTIVKPSQIGTPAHASRGIRRRDGPRAARCKPLLSFELILGALRHGLHGNHNTPDLILKIDIELGASFPYPLSSLRS